MAAPLRPSVAIQPVKASPRPSVAVPSSKVPPAPTMAAPIVAPPASTAKPKLDPETQERYAGLLLGYIVPKGKGEPSQPSVQPTTIPPWKKSRYYKSVPPRGSARQSLVEMSEPNDEGRLEPPPNPAEAGTSRASTDFSGEGDVEMVGPTGDVEVVASRDWVEHPWEPTAEDLT